jgi:triosephosphate isomerase (TIM)
MSKRSFIVAGNWKMYKSIEEALQWSSRFLADYRAAVHVQVPVFPPFTALFPLHGAFRGPGLSLGAQNLHSDLQGAYTGEISGPMIREAGADWVLIGHSERRQYQQEQEALLAEKIRTALDCGLRPVYCVGESLAEREEGSHLDKVQQQLLQGIPPLSPAEWGRLVLAYEPVWAIGTGRTATVEDASAMHRHIREVLVKTHPSISFGELPILYGGSVKPENAGELFDHPEINGVLVGGASLDAGSFLAIVEEAQRRR